MIRIARVWFFVAWITLLIVLVGCRARVEQIPSRPESSAPLGKPTPVRSTPQPALPEKRLVSLEWPQTIREQDSDLIVLTIAMDDSGRLTPTVQGVPGTQIDIPNLYETHNIFALARLDLAGMNAFGGDIREPLRPGSPVTFRWSIRAGDPGLYRGVVWLHIEMVPKGGGQAEQQLILARPIEIQTVTVFGLPAGLARWLGWIGLVVSTVLGYPFIQHWLEPFLKRRGSPGAGRKASPGDQPVTDHMTKEEIHQPELRR